MLKPTCKLRFIERTVQYDNTSPIDFTVTKLDKKVRVLQQFWEETINVGWADLPVNDKTGAWRDVELVDDPDQT